MKPVWIERIRRTATAVIVLTWLVIVLAACQSSSPPVVDPSTPIPAPTADPTVVATPDIPPPPQLPTPSPAAPTAAPVEPPPTVTPTATVAVVIPAPPTATPLPVRGSVGVVAAARSIDSMQRPRGVTDTFAESERVYVSAEYVGIQAGSSIGITWLREGIEIFTYEQPINDTFTRGYFGFYLDAGEGNGPGNFSAHVLIDGQIQRTVEFTIA